jgi:sialidase-1
MRCCRLLVILVVVASRAQAADRPEPPPKYLNPLLIHANVEDSMRDKYLSICADICELADGNLLIAYHRSSSFDWGGDYSIWTRMSHDGGVTWSEPRLVAKKAQAPGLLRLRSGDLLLDGGHMISERSCTLKLFRSKDNGQTWVEQKPIFANSPGVYCQGGNGELVQLRSGRILAPMDVNNGRGNYDYGEQACCYYSDDDGKTWRQGKGRVSLPLRGAMEPTVAELKDGTVVMGVRTQLGSVYISHSADHGDTWSTPWSSKVETPEECSVLAAFPDGRRLLLIHNAGKFQPEHHHKGERTPMSAAVSDDGGKTWRNVGDIVGGPHEFGPGSVCFTSRGKVLIAYNWGRIPWDRTIRTGGVRVAIADPKWFDGAESAQHAAPSHTKQLDPAYENNPAFRPVHDYPLLPRVLLIGDSISMGYTVPVQNALAGKANVHRIPDNGRHTRQGLEDLDWWLADGRWDVIHFNFGIHDLTREQGKCEVPLEQYKRNLRKLVERLKKTKATLIWCSTTPVPPDYRHSMPAVSRSNADVIAYNTAAKKIMEENGIAVDDLYAYSLPQLAKIQYPGDVHFSNDGSKVLARQVAAAMMKALTKPVAAN